MKRFYIYMVLVCLFASCTQNGIYIGPIYGKWQLREIQSENDATTYDSIFYNFQVNIVRLDRLSGEDPHSAKYNMGYFTHIDNELALYLRECPIERAQTLYQLPDTSVIFKVLQLNNRRMVLRLSEGNTYTFWKTGAIGSE